MRNYLGLKNCRNCDHWRYIAAPPNSPDIEKCTLKHSQVCWPGAKAKICRWFKPNSKLKEVLEEYNAI